jgi:hypothetical protein
MASVLTLVAGTSMTAADLGNAFAPWSAWGEVDVEKLAAGKIWVESNSSMRFARGLSGQAVFVADAPVDVTARAWLAIDPKTHPELDVYQQRWFQDESDAQFESLKFDTKIKPVRSLLDSMHKKGGVQLTAEERAAVPSGTAPGDVAKFFSGVLRKRWNAAMNGDLGNVGGADIRSEIKSILGEESAIEQHFATILQPLKDPALKPAPQRSYWSVSKVNGIATVALGSVFLLTTGDRTQLLDVVYYASSGYYTSVTLYELVPVPRGGKSQTLGWQGSLVSSPELAGAFGVKQKVAGMLMKSDLERAVKMLQKDAAAANRR